MNAPPDKPAPPEPPDPGDCCGGGCVRCVFDVYDEQLAAWREACARIDDGNVPGSDPASRD